MLRLWILPVLGLIAVLGLACRDGGNDLPAAIATATPTGPATAVTTTAEPSMTAPQPTAAVTSHFPAATLGPATFTDAKYGYSYSVPAGWYVAGEEGYSVVTSYDPAKATGPGDVPPELLKAETYVYINDQALALQTWIDQNTSGAEIKTVSGRQISGHQAIERSVSLTASGGAAATQYFFEDADRVFAIIVYTSNEALLSEFDVLLNTFRVGQ